MFEFCTPAAPPAVGEKKSEEADLPGASTTVVRFEAFEVPIGAAFKWSRDMVELAPTTLYIPRFFPGTADIAFKSDMF